ncbi:hypothetical protein [Streptomyces sp. TLI_146]|uniref:hypothetical protein n=1 Tax=Streptomyces sp. TLI_146 TaxID=1938858 RepID=UPI000C7128B9|nr:hypothetical protein [Streptomyces sp. TLI_146]PKV84224.1 hypothetical protein BX283_1735 [Streptomyces sp. TLI_146]
MYLMRLLSPEDRPLVDALLTARTAWAQQQGCPHHGHSLALLSLLANGHDTTQIIGMEEDGDLVGIFTLAVREAALVGWSGRRKPCRSPTPPRHGQRLARLGSLWLADYITHLPGPPRWVRGAVSDSAVALYLQGVCGWQLVRYSRDPDGRRAYRLQLPAQATPGLRHLVTTSAELAAPLADPASSPIRGTPARPDLLPR